MGTTWRIYFVEVVRKENYFELILYNILNKKVGKVRAKTRKDVKMMLDGYKAVEPKFQYIWEGE